MNQTLFIPKSICIQFRNKDNASINYKNILVGIKTHATRKNDIDIYPFLTDETGCINITAEQIKQEADNFISYGLMDYSTLESAKPLIEIYYWGIKSIERYLQHYTDKLLNQKTNYNTEIFLNHIRDDFRQEMEETENRERIEYEIFKECHNLNLPIENNVLLASDKWDIENEHLEYNVTLPL
jgi:hypothetical protein